MSKAQLEQDLWVLQKHGPLPGFFLEIGAFHPSDLSNTCLLEERGWTGVSVDPFPAGDWTQRPNTVLAREVVTGTGGPVSFIKGDELGGVETHVSHHLAKVANKPRVTLDSITPSTLLDTYRVPLVIDYMSLDTEGNELDILEHFPFDRYTVKLISVEHNFEEPARSNIEHVLKTHGFRKDRACRWDDLYVRA